MSFGHISKMAGELSDEQIARLKTIYLMLDKDNEDKIVIKDVIFALKWLGEDLSDNALKTKLERILNHFTYRSCSFDTFAELMKKILERLEGNGQKIIFSCDNEKGIKKEDLKSFMQIFGEELNEEEINEMLSDELFKESFQNSV